MQFITPSVILLAETKLITEGVEQLLEIIGAPEWQTDAPTDAEKLIEIAGRLCYRSFAPGLNPNVTKIREGNQIYINNILKQRHGSVVEHPSLTVAFLNVSRTMTHELVRHRLASFSQESLRYVRLTELRAYYPKAFQKTVLAEVIRDISTNTDDANLPQKLENKLHELFQRVFENLEDMQKTISSMFDNLKSFELKKKLTSATRRLAPIGLATHIIMTTNHRNWRHVLEQRSDQHAEEEIQFVFSELGRLLIARYPNIYQDAVENEQGEFKFANSKI